MPKKDDEVMVVTGDGSEAKPFRASVSFEMTMDELNKLVDLCADNGLFRLGIMLAERKSRLKANVARVKKDAAALAANGAGE